MAVDPQESDLLQQRVEIYDSILHDLRSGMTVVTAGLHAATFTLKNTTVTADAEALHHIERALRTAEHCSQICKRYAGIMSGRKAKQVCAPVDEVLGDLEHFLKLHPASRTGSVHVHRLEKSCVPFMHAPDLLQILVNLAINGCEACGDHAKVEITPRLVSSSRAIPESGGHRIAGALFSPDTEALCIEIQDSGCGIAPERLSGMFTAYESGKEDNLGLGLAIARRLISGAAAALEIGPSPSHGTVARVFANLIPSSACDTGAIQPTKG